MKLISRSIDYIKQEFSLRVSLETYIALTLYVEGNDERTMASFYQMFDSSVRELVEKELLLIYQYLRSDV